MSVDDGRSTTLDADDIPENARRSSLLIGILVSSVSAMLAVVHIVWPEVEIDAVTLGLLAIAVAPWLGTLFASVELPGGWKFEYREFKRSVKAELSEKEKQVDELTYRVARVEQFVFTGDVTPEIKVRLGRSLERFHAYLQSRGYRSDHALPTVHIENTDMKNAYYDIQENRIVVGIEVSDDPDVVVHEYAQYILGTMVPGSALSSWRGVEGPYSAAFTPLALQVALSDYFTCSFKNDACLGRGIAMALGLDHECLRRMDSNPTIESVPAVMDAATEQYAGAAKGSAVWAAAFWELRSKAGPQSVDTALVGAWTSLASDEQELPSSERFLGQLLEILADFSDGFDQREIFASRGLVST